MTEKQTELYEKIQAFDIDGGPVQFSFAQRLARENGWSPNFTNRAIDEYRKFLFLAAEAGHPITPSDEVDQVWHLHLTYSDSYWNRLCKEILPKPLLHGPTKGGKAEGDKFQDWYAKTLDSYRGFFGEPPTDIWPEASIRFGEAPFFQRVNVKDNWVIPKAKVRRVILVGGGVLGSATLITGCGYLFAESDATIPLLIIIGSVILFIIISASRNRRGGGGPSGGSTGCSSCGTAIGTDHSSHGHSGCGSHGGHSGCGGHGGDSGCGSSGCGSSGCGGGGCGGGCGGGD